MEKEKRSHHERNGKAQTIRNKYERSTRKTEDRRGQKGRKKKNRRKQKPPDDVRMT